MIMNVSIYFLVWLLIELKQEVGRVNRIFSSYVRHLVFMGHSDKENSDQLRPFD